MALKLVVESNFVTVQKDLSAFAASTKKEAKSMAKAYDNVKGGNLDALVNRNKRLAQAVEMTRGKTESLVIQKRNLQNRIEQLISSGVSPETEGMKKLRAEYDNVTRATEKNAEAVKMQNSLRQKANQLANAGVVAVGALGAAMVANTFSVAKTGDALAKTSFQLGLTAESLQELTFAAERSGVSADVFSSSFERFNMRLGEAQVGTGALASGLGKMNPELLAQLTAAENSSEAFEIMSDALSQVENEQQRAALASAAFGKSGMAIVGMTAQGSQGIQKLREESQRYGVITNEQAALSEKLVDAQTNLKMAFSGLTNELGAQLMPAIITVVEGITAFITDSQKMKIMLDIVLPIVAAIGGAFTAWFVITKVIALVQGLKIAMVALNIAMSANPIGIIVVAVGALIGLLVVLARNWDKVKIGFTMGLNYILLSFSKLADYIVDNVFPILKKSYDAMSKLPLIGDKMKMASAGIDVVGERIKSNSAKLRENSEAAIENAKAQIRAMKDVKEEQVKPVKPKAGIVKTVAVAGAITAGAVAGGGEETSFADRLKTLENQEKISYQQRYNNFSEFLTRRMEQEKVTGDEREAFLQEEYQRTLESDLLKAEEKIAAEQAFQDRILAVQKEAAEKEAALVDEKVEKERKAFEARKAIQLQMVGIVSDTFSSIDEIMKNSGKNMRAFIILQKGLAAVEIFINTQRAIRQIMTDQSLPYVSKLPLSIAEGVRGAASIAAVVSRPVPSAETGTGPSRFTVPNTSSRSDSVPMMVNPGEEVEVHPRGESGGSAQNIQVVVNDSVLFEAVNRGIDSGNVRITADNIQGLAI